MQNSINVAVMANQKLLGLLSLFAFNNGRLIKLVTELVTS